MNNIGGIFAVPHDISVIRFDDLSMSAVMDIPLTTFAVSKQSMGRSASELCASKLIEVRVHSPDRALMDGKLIERNSVVRRTA
jgi:DNA-binding LacI/PurR family transcriptional regulator